MGSNKPAGNEQRASVWYAYLEASLVSKVQISSPQGQLGTTRIPHGCFVTYLSEPWQYPMDSAVWMVACPGHVHYFFVFTRDSAAWSRVQHRYSGHGVLPIVAIRSVRGAYRRLCTRSTVAGGTRRGNWTTASQTAAQTRITCQGVPDSSSQEWSHRLDLLPLLFHCNW